MGKGLSSSTTLRANKLALLPLKKLNQKANSTNTQAGRINTGSQDTRHAFYASAAMPGAGTRPGTDSQPLIPVCSSEARTRGTPRCTRNPDGRQTPVGTVTAKLLAPRALSHREAAPAPSGAAPHRPHPRHPALSACTIGDCLLKSLG